MDQSHIREKNMIRVIKTAQELFLQNGVQNTSINRIAKAAGLSATSLYRYFDNKDNIVFWTWKDSLLTFYDTLMPLYNARCHNAKNGYEKFLICLDCHVEIYQKEPTWLEYTREMFTSVSTQPHRKEHNEARKESTKVDAFWEFYGREIPLPILKALQEGVEDGSIRQDVNIYELYQLVFNVYTGCNIYQYFSSDTDPLSIFTLTKSMLKDYIKPRNNTEA